MSAPDEMGAECGIGSRVRADLEEGRRIIEAATPLDPPPGCVVLGPAVRERLLPGSVAPRARRLADTLIDLANFHGSPGLRALGERIRREFVDRGVEVEEHFVHTVIDAAASTFGVAA